MKTLVTGATGFIGSHIVDHLLERGDDVRALVRPHSNIHRLKEQGVHLVQGDLFDSETLNLATKGVDVVYHAAALLDVSGDGKSIYDVNVIGVKNLLDACVQSQIERIVFISSIAAYNAFTKGTIIREDTPLGGSSTYGRTKAEAETLMKFYGDSFGLPYSVIRPCVTYGERDYNFTPRLLNLLRRQFIPIVAGNSMHMILVHAADVACAAILAGTHPKAIGQAYNITNGSQTSLRELAKIYQELSGQQKHLVPIPKFLWRGIILIRSLMSRRYNRQFRQAFMEEIKNESRRESFFLRNHHYDINRAEAELGFKPNIGLKEGLRRALAWYG